MKVNANINNKKYIIDFIGLNCCTVNNGKNTFFVKYAKKETVPEVLEKIKKL